MPAAHGLRLRRGRVEHPDAHRGALVDERGVRADRLPGAGQRDRLGEREAVLPGGEPAALQARGGRRELGPQPWADLLAQRLEVASRREDLVVGTLDLEAHPQVVGELGQVPGVRRHADVAHLGERPGHVLEERRTARLEPLEHLPDDLGHRDERPAQVLRQPAQQRGEQLAAQGGDEPLEPVGPHGAQEAQRDVRGHAVVGRPRLEAVGQLELDLALTPGRRPAAPREPVRGRGVDEQLPRVREEVRVRAARVAPPAVEVLAGHDALGHPRVEEVVEDLVGDEDPPAADAVLQRLDLLQRLAVGVEERVARRPVALDERLADEHLPRGHRVDAPVGDLPAVDDREAVQASRAPSRRPSPACGPSTGRRTCGGRGGRRAARSTPGRCARPSAPTAATSPRARRP